MTHPEAVKKVELPSIEFRESCPAIAYLDCSPWERSQINGAWRDAVKSYVEVIERIEGDMLRALKGNGRRGLGNDAQALMNAADNHGRMWALIEAVEHRHALAEKEQA